MLLAMMLATVGPITVFAQQQPPDPTRTPGVQAPNDPNRAAFVMANCKNAPPPPAPARGGGGGGGGQGARGGGGGRGDGRGGAPAATGPADYAVTAIPGVIAAGQRWRQLWTDTGNNADSPIGVEDGVFVAQNDKSQIVKVLLNGRAELVATDTYTGGALAMNTKGQLFSGQRALNKAIWQILPQRRLFANTKDGEPLECLGPANISDMVADSKGGVYFTMGGVYYANAQGVVTGRHTMVNGNGLILSRDEKTLYVTGRLAEGGGAAAAGSGLVALDVQPDGSLRNERNFVELPGGDGLAIDNEGRIYVTTGNDGVHVVSPEGKMLGNIPAPYGLISVAFGGPNKRTLFGVSIRDVHILGIDVQAQGIQSRPK
jgi:gluconolactonase